MTSERQVAFEDSIYGEVIIETPVVLELINSASMQRLKGINQLGVPDKYFYRKGYSRFEHSVGVMLLLKHLGATEEEQLAGLLHDVSHHSFSHVFDWVVGNAVSENTQDTSHKKFLLNSEVPAILASYGYDVNKLVDFRDFGLLEREIPDLCADRVDYALRQMNIEIARKVLSGLTVFGGQIVTKDLETAAVFAREFLSLQVNHWGGREGVARYYHFSKILRLALQTGIITKADFLEDDEHITSKLEKSGNEEILDLLKYLERRPLPIFDDRIIVYKKFRYTDPLLLRDGKLVRLSEVDDEFAALLEQAKEDNKKGVLV